MEEEKKEQLESLDCELDTVESEIVDLTHLIQMLDLERKQAAENLGKRQAKRQKIELKIKEIKNENS